MAEEIRGIEQLIAPWLRVEVYGARYLAKYGALAPYEFDTTVLPFGAPEDPPDLRAELLRRAESALAALDDAGWQLTSYPVMEFTGELMSPFSQTLDGQLVEPARTGLIGLRMRFEINRPR